ncbi:MAG: hypothetical protein ACI8O8_000957 [Oleiphilaceae bacterium]
MAKNYCGLIEAAIVAKKAVENDISKEAVILWKYAVLLMSKLFDLKDFSVLV